MLFGTFNSPLNKLLVMGYWADLKHYARSRIEDIDDQSASLTVSKDDPINSDTVTLSLTWEKEFEDRLYDEGGTRLLPTSRQVKVEGGTVHEDTPSIFNTLVRSIEFDGDVDSITLKESSMMVDSPFVATYGLSRTSGITRRGADVLEELEDIGSEDGLDFTLDDIVECGVVYSDFNPNEASSVNAYLRTDRPWEYLANVESSEGIAEKIDDPENFRSSDYCIVPFTANQEGLSDTRTKFCEDQMESFVDEFVNTSFDYTLEGESIYVRTGEVRDEDYCIAKPDFEYDEPDGDESVYCWLHADATEILDSNLLSSDSS